MLRIGFTKRFFTLWDVIYNPNGTRASSCFVQNLSKDKEKAREKAKMMGVSDLSIDYSLKWWSERWYADDKDIISSELPSSTNPAFTFGKYNGILIEDAVGDIGHIKWYYNKTKNRYAEVILKNNGYIIDGDYAYTEAEHADYLSRSYLKTDGIKHVTFTTNIGVDDHRIVVETDNAVYSRLPVSQSILDEVKRGQYRNFEWLYLPKVSKRRSMKNQSVKIRIESGKIQEVETV